LISQKSFWHLYSSTGVVLLPKPCLQIYGEKEPTMCRYYKFNVSFLQLITQNRDSNASVLQFHSGFTIEVVLMIVRPDLLSPNK